MIVNYKGTFKIKPKAQNCCLCYELCIRLKSLLIPVVVLKSEIDTPRAGEITILFCPGGGVYHLLPHTGKVNAPHIPEVGGAGISNDWCITVKIQKVYCFHFCTLL